MNKRQKLVQKQFLNDEQAVIRRLNQVYGKALTDVEGKIKNLTFTIGKLQQEYDWMDDTDPKKARIKSMIQSKIYQKNFQEQLRAQLDPILKTMTIAQFETVSEYLDDCYSNGFIGAFFDQHGQGVPIVTPIDQQSMVRAVQLESKISKGLYTRLGEDVDLLKKKITAQVSRGIATGMSYRDVAKQLENYTRIGYNKSIRIARTEGHRIQTTAAMDAMEAAKDRGADVLKQWDATLDGATRESHVAVDGEIREVDKPFSNGLMYPGDPAGGAAEVINCRCALLQRARWAVEGEDKSFTKFNNFTKQVESFDSPESYGEFKKAFFHPDNVEYMRYVQQMQDKYGTMDFKRILAQMSDREYTHYSRLLAKNPLYNKKASAVAQAPVDVDTIRSELRAISRDIATVRNDISTAQRSLYYGADRDAVNARINDLQQKLSTLKSQATAKGKLLIENMNTTFRVSTDNEDFISLIVELDSRIEYREVMKLASDRVFDEIISTLGGGDNTSGSCASVGLGYIGQKNGWDVLDFRGGNSMDWFSGKANKVNMWKALGVPSIVEDSGKSNITNGKRILSRMEKGKEYYLSVGRHAAIVRKNDDGVLQYLELQSASNCGWINFNGNPGYTLKTRFGCSSSSAYYSTAYLTDIGSVKDSAEFRTILGYINTSGSMQRKGANGTIK